METQSNKHREIQQQEADERGKAKELWKHISKQQGIEEEKKQKIYTNISKTQKRETQKIGEKQKQNWKNT